MNKTGFQFLIMTAVAAGAFCAVAASKPAEAPKKPNIVFLLVDDLGVNLERAVGRQRIAQLIHSQRFVKKPRRTFGCTCVFSQTAASKAAARFICVQLLFPGLKIWPELLKQNGYATYFLGKWHMGDADSE